MSPTRRQHNRYIHLFVPLPRGEELVLLLHDTANFSRTQHYLEPLIDDALSKFEFTSAQQRSLRRELLADIAVAARRFLNSSKSTEADYKFCTYFSWYIAQRISMKN